MFERPMQEHPAMGMSIMSAVAFIWLAMGAWYVLPMPKEFHFINFVFILTSGLGAVGMGVIGYAWAKATPKWKLVRDRMERSL